mmetsp:Transcript_16449/g.62510  ORF Transcript_16449/g.62510 Transcript_16449/m.62510 type:complete len:275 (+) Transcript_16449:599-1423(+)
MLWVPRCRCLNVTSHSCHHTFATGVLAKDAQDPEGLGHNIFIVDVGTQTTGHRDDASVPCGKLHVAGDAEAHVPEELEQNEHGLPILQMASEGSNDGGDRATLSCPLLLELLAEHQSGDCFGRCLDNFCIFCVQLRHCLAEGLATWGGLLCCSGCLRRGRLLVLCHARGQMGPLSARPRAYDAASYLWRSPGEREVELRPHQGAEAARALQPLPSSPSCRAVSRSMEGVSLIFRSAFRLPARAFTPSILCRKIRPVRTYREVRSMSCAAWSSPG